jgi:hypothetical protein
MNEGTPVRAGAVLAELKQADFVASMWQPPAPGNAKPVPGRKTPARMIEGVNPPKKAQQASRPALIASRALEMRSSWRPIDTVGQRASRQPEQKKR